MQRACTVSNYAAELRIRLENAMKYECKRRSKMEYARDSQAGMSHQHIDI